MIMLNTKKVLARCLGKNNSDKTCDFCGRDITGNWYDGKTTQGPWATMCKSCFSANGVGLGTGKGQEFDNTGKKLRG